MNAEKLIAERSAFRDAAQQYGKGILTGQADSAADGSSRVDEIADRLREVGCLSEVLKPLLHDDNPHVRFAAAAHLNRDGDVEAHQVLDNLAQGTGLASILAKIAITPRRQPPHS